MRNTLWTPIRRRHLLAILALGLLLGIYVFLEPHWLKVRRYTIAGPDVPPAFDGKTIAFVSDIHHGPYLSQERVEGLVEKVNRLEPDLILFGGDYVHRDPKYILPCFEALQGIHAPLGVFGVLGNHDHWEDAGLTRKCMMESGIEPIDNRGAWVLASGDRIRIGGVGDLWEDSQDLEAAVGDASEDDFVVLLSHNPDYVEEIDSKRVDLVLSGHTHGGQVSLFDLWAPLVPSRYGQKYRTGMVETDSTRVIVCNGVGTIAPPVRFWARPDILLITLVRGRSEQREENTGD